MVRIHPPPCTRGELFFTGLKGKTVFFPTKKKFGALFQKNRLPSAQTPPLFPNFAKIVNPPFPGLAVEINDGQLGFLFAEIFSFLRSFGPFKFFPRRGFSFRSKQKAPHFPNPSNYWLDSNFGPNDFGWELTLGGFRGGIFL